MVATRRRNRGVAAGGDDTTASPVSGSPQKRALDPVLRADDKDKAPKRMYEAHQGGPGWGVTEAACSCGEGVNDPECKTCFPVPAKAISNGPEHKRRVTTTPSR